jgi:DNA-binding response OmpR family regulator
VDYYRGGGHGTEEAERILIIDDDVELCALLTERLSMDGYAVESVHDGVTGLERAVAVGVALVILDLMLPRMAGIEVLRRLRARSGVPVLILSARGEDVERILGLEIGADDYVAKPFNPRELVARIRAILRRVSRSAAMAGPLSVGDVSLEPSARAAWINGTPLALTSVEFTLLETLLQKAGHAVTREHLTEVVLGRKLGAFDRVIDVHVSNLRKKLGTAERIKSVRGAGYLFVVRMGAG